MSGRQRFVVELRLQPGADDRLLLEATLAAAAARANRAGQAVEWIGISRLSERGAPICLFDAAERSAVDYVLAIANLPAGRHEDGEPG